MDLNLDAIAFFYGNGADVIQFFNLSSFRFRKKITKMIDCQTVICSADVGATYNSLAVDHFCDLFPETEGGQIKKLNYVSPITVKKGDRIEVQIHPRFVSILFSARCDRLFLR